MILKGKNLNKVYTALQGAFYEVTEIDLRFKRGEKGRTKRIFTLVSEAQGIRDPEQIDTVIETFYKYITHKTVEWMLWDKSCRQNYFGFLDNKENIKLFVKSLSFESPKTTKKQEVVKTKTNDEWEW